MNVRTIDLLPGDILDGTDTLDRCPVHVGGVIYALEVTRRIYGRTVSEVRYAGRDAIHEIVR